MSLEKILYELELANRGSFSLLTKDKIKLTFSQLNILDFYSLQYHKDLLLLDSWRKLIVGSVFRGELPEWMLDNLTNIPRDDVWDTTDIKQFEAMVKEGAISCSNSSF